MITFFKKGFFPGDGIVQSNFNKDSYSEKMQRFSPNSKKWAKGTAAQFPLIFLIKKGKQETVLFKKIIKNIKKLKNMY